MPMNIYSTGAIAQVVRTIQPVRPFLFQSVFRNKVFARGKEILFDVEIGRRRVSPFVAPRLPGKLVNSKGYRTDRIEPANIKDVRVLDPDRVLSRQAGEPIGGAPALDPGQREQALLRQELQDMADMYWRRQEVMAADALIDGIVTVTGDGYDAVTVNYGRAAGHSVTLTSTARWTTDDVAIQSGVSPIANVETWRSTALQNSGLPMTDIVFTPDAWRIFKKDPDFKTAVDTTLRGTTAAANFSPEGMEGGELVGYLNNQTRLWQYQNWYVDPADDTEKVVLPAYSVVMFNNSPDGAQSRGYGVIQDALLGYPSVEWASRAFVPNDPAVTHIIGQGAPLPILSRPNATFYAKVK
jgi:hypothetical protein